MLYPAKLFFLAIPFSQLYPNDFSSQVFSEHEFRGEMAYLPRLLQNPGSKMKSSFRASEALHRMVFRAKRDPESRICK
jgi:hypothetical protein